jgi:hypothetical protein
MVVQNNRGSLMEAAGVNLEIVRTRYGWWFVR